MGAASGGPPSQLSLAKFVGAGISPGMLSQATGKDSLALGNYKSGGMRVYRTEAVPGSAESPARQT